MRLVRAAGVQEREFCVLCFCVLVTNEKEKACVACKGCEVANCTPSANQEKEVFSLLAKGPARLESARAQQSSLSNPEVLFFLRLEQDLVAPHEKLLDGIGEILRVLEQDEVRAERLYE